VFEKETWRSSKHSFVAEIGPVLGLQLDQRPSERKATNDKQFTGQNCDGKERKKLKVVRVFPNPICLLFIQINCGKRPFRLRLFGLFFLVFSLFATTFFTASPQFSCCFARLPVKAICLRLPSPTAAAEDHPFHPRVHHFLERNEIKRWI
jgi:hypothetical protein